MTEYASSPYEQSKLAAYMAEQVVSRSSGRSNESCLGNYPHDVYFVGNLRSDSPLPGGSPSARVTSELVTKLSPVAFGSDFRLKGEGNGSIYVQLTWACYYRVMPTFEQQQKFQRVGTIPTAAPNPKHQLAAASTSVGPVNDGGSSGTEEPDENDDDVVDQAAGSDDDNTPVHTPHNDALQMRFRRIACRAEERLLLTTDDQGTKLCTESALERAIQAEFERVKQQILDDSDLYRTRGAPDENIQVPASALANATAFSTFLAQFRIPVVPSWTWDLRCTLRRDPQASDTTIASIMFVNSSPRQATAAGRENPNLESYLFETSAEFRFEGWRSGKRPVSRPCFAH